MIEFIKGDLLETGLPIIAHQVNTLGIMGAGIAKQIAIKHPTVYEQYKAKCPAPLGTCLIVKLPNEEGTQYVANIFAQNKIGIGPCLTDYNALHTGLTCLLTECLNMGITEVGIPARIGCGLAGGDWEGVVLPMIKEIFEDNLFVKLYICEL